MDPLVDIGEADLDLFLEGTVMFVLIQVVKEHRHLEKFGWAELVHIGFEDVWQVGSHIDAFRVQRLHQQKLGPRAGYLYDFDELILLGAIEEVVLDKLKQCVLEL